MPNQSQGKIGATDVQSEQTLDFRPLFPPSSTERLEHLPGRDPHPPDPWLGYRGLPTGRRWAQHSDTHAETAGVRGFRVEWYPCHPRPSGTESRRMRKMHPRMNGRLFPKHKQMKGRFPFPSLAVVKSVT